MAGLLSQVADLSTADGSYKKNENLKADCSAQYEGPSATQHEYTARTA